MVMAEKRLHYMANIGEMKVSVINSAGGSFCFNYATDLCIYGNYASDNVCCIKQVFRCYFLLLVCWWIFL